MAYCTEMSFKGRTPHASRVLLAAKLLAAHPDRVPVVVDVSKELRLHADRFMVPRKTPLAFFLKELRAESYHIKQSNIPDCLSTDVLTPLSPETGVYVMVSGKGILPPVTNTMEEIYGKHKEDDNILYLSLCLETSFGQHAPS